MAHWRAAPSSPANMASSSSDRRMIVALWQPGALTGWPSKALLFGVRCHGRLEDRRQACHFGFDEFLQGFGPALVPLRGGRAQLRIALEHGGIVERPVERVNELGLGIARQALR